MQQKIGISLATTLALLLTGCDALTGTDADGVAEAEAETTVAVAADGKAAGDAAMDIGNDASDWANDSECDDPRFVGEGMAASLVTDNIGQDATDCQSALDAGRIEPNPLFATPASDAAINYGDDKGNFANDGDCDDIRFTGAYASEMIYLVEDIGHDATDCRNAMTSGAASWQGNTANPEHGVRVM